MVFVCLTPPWHKGGCFHNIKDDGKSWGMKLVFGWILADFEQFLLWLSLTTFINETDPKSLWEFSNMIV